MKQLLAKTKGKAGKYFKVFKDDHIFELPETLSDAIEYDSDYKLDDEQWFKIKDFTNKEYCDELLKIEFLSTEYNSISQDDYKNISHFVSFDKGVYLYQKVTPYQLLRKRYIALDTSPRIIKSTSIIPIPNFVDACFKKDDNTLYFKKLSRVNTIFKGIDVIYREATDDETKTFLNNDIINLEDDFNSSKVKKANRKRIALAMDALNNFSKPDKKNILKYIGDYCAELKYDEKKSKYRISSEDDLKKLLFGIEQRYYTTLVGEEKRVANSILKLQ